MKRKRRRAKRPPSVSRTEGNVLLRVWCDLVTGSVLSVGSGEDKDKEGGRYRSYFANASSYTTSDIVPGSDLTLDIRKMPEVRAGAYGAVFCHSVLEHVDEPWAALREISRILAPGGVLILGVPFQYGIHRAPHDYWRFTEYGVRYMLSTVAELQVDDVVGVDGPPGLAAVYWSRARKP